MYEFKLNIKKNAILIILKGCMDTKEALEIVKKFKQGVDKLKPGFTAITDLSDFVPVSEGVRIHIKTVMEYAVENKIGRVIRIVADTPTSNIGELQFTRTAQEFGYKADRASTLKEAKQMLGWH
ncbi:MAG: hypothetical protein GY795_00660 [Desulfobacterales bacterium]|nr:hypothetical protein [Desulfobacterales bacterium]